jgi:hypothetical protein
MAQLGPRSYDYKTPRRINLVSVGLLLLVVAAVYSGMKFGPVYYKRYKIEHILEETKAEASDLYRMSQDRKHLEKRRLVESTTAKIEAQGITVEDNQLQVYFGQLDESINADWTVVVKHPFGKQTVFEIHREAALAQEPGGFD